MGRQRERIRRKALVVDSDSAPDLARFEQPIALKTAGKRLWQHFADQTPFWWSEADIPTLAILCAATDATAAALRDSETSAAGKAAMLQQWRGLAGELGLSPTSRGRLRLTEAQSTVAAKKAEKMKSETDSRRAAIPIEVLTDDG